MTAVFAVLASSILTAVVLTYRHQREMAPLCDELGERETALLAYVAAVQLRDVAIEMSNNEIALLLEENDCQGEVILSLTAAHRDAVLDAAEAVQVSMTCISDALDRALGGAS